VLSFAEEIMLLLHDDASGDFIELPQAAFTIVLGGAALMDLAIRNRVDTDLERLTVVDRTPLGDGSSSSKPLPTVSSISPRRSTREPPARTPIGRSRFADLSRTASSRRRTGITSGFSARGAIRSSTIRSSRKSGRGSGKSC
jgi:hypothetical protein